MKLNQVCAYANWPNESFEIWRLYLYNKSHKEIAKEMRSLFLWVFSRIVANKSLEELEHASFTIGGTDQGIEINSSKAKDIMKRVYYGWYQGVCLDRKRLQYFRPDRIIRQGIVKLVGKNEAEIWDTPSPVESNNVTVPNRTLQLRRILGDDPKRIEVDESRSRLGLQKNFLLHWKVEYEISKDKKTTK